MSDTIFELLGHDNPLGRYPAPVVPVGRLNGNLVVIYSGNEMAEPFGLEEDCEFVKHGALLRETLRAFDWRRHRLFAFSKNDVVIYLIEFEHDFFTALLSDRTFSIENPFLRLSIAKATYSVELIKQEVALCALTLSQSAPSFVDNWYEAQILALTGEVDNGSQTAFPSRWQDLQSNGPSGNELAQKETKIERDSLQPAEISYHYTIAAQLLNRISVADYDGEEERDELLQRAEEGLNKGKLEGGGPKGTGDVIFELEKQRLGYLREHSGQAEKRFDELKKIFGAATHHELLAKAKAYQEFINERRKAAQSPRIATGGLYDYLIVGAGFAGSVLAERLASGSDKRVLICDKRPHIGGNAYDHYNDDGILVHKYGPHIFHTNSREVFEYLSRFTEWRPYQHRVRASVDGQIVPIPINLDTINALYGLNLTSFEVEEFFKKVAEPIERTRTSEDVVVSKVGRELYEKFFRNYTRKQWGLDPSELDASVTSRVPTRTNRDDRYFTDTYQAMPLHGYTRMFENMLDHPNIKVMLNCDYREIERAIPFKEMIYTGPVDSYFDYCYGKLPYRSLEFRHETHNMPVYQSTPTINYPNEQLYTRVTEFKYLTGQEHPQTSIVYEFPKSQGDAYYPVPRKENAELYARYKALADATPNVHFVGRLATYKYYNMDQIVAQALTTYGKIAGMKRIEAMAQNRKLLEPEMILESESMTRQLRRIIEGK